MKNQSDKEREICFNAHKKCLSSPRPIYLGLQINWIEEALKPEKPKIFIKPKITDLLDVIFP